MRRELFAIKHKPSGGFLPELPSGVRAGYTHMEPTTFDIPRLFLEKGGAKRALTWWLKGATSVSRYTGYIDEDYDETWSLKEMPERKAEDMEVVKVLLQT